MKEITKDNKGITIISLIITIIIMTILVSVTTYSGISSYENAKITGFVAQMQLIQSKVDGLVGSKTIEEINSMGLKEITTEEQINAIKLAYNNSEITTNNTSKYKLLTVTDLLNMFDIDDIENDIMVNFETREVVSTKGIEYEGTTYYTQYKLPNGQTIIQDTAKTDRKLTFSISATINGLNANIKISNISITNGTLSYREQNTEYWNSITNYTEKNEEYNITVSKSATYEFVLIDNVTGVNSNIKNEGVTEIVPEANKKTVLLTNSPKTNQSIEAVYDYSKNSDNWADMDYNGQRYVWIPRFAYKINTETGINEIKFLKGNSNIATDNTYIDDTWTIHEKFTNNGTELTGVWININIQIGIEDMDRVLNDASYDINTEINL